MIESFFVSMALTILKGTIKNPASVAKEGAIISNLAQVATEADTAINGTIWTSQTVAAAPAAAAPAPAPAANSAAPVAAAAPANSAAAPVANGVAEILAK